MTARDYYRANAIRDYYSRAKAITGLNMSRRECIVEVEAYDCTLLWHFFSNASLFHSNSIEEPEKDCSYLTPGDTVHCVYFFGETVLHSTHKYGRCPWKLKEEEK